MGFVYRTAYSLYSRGGSSGSEAYSDPTMRHKWPGNERNIPVTVLSMLGQQPVKERALRECQHGVVGHREEIGSQAERICYVHHHKAGIPQLGIRDHQVVNADIVGKSIIGQLQVGFSISRRLEQMLQCPDRRHVRIAPR